MQREWAFIQLVGLHTDVGGMHNFPDMDLFMPWLDAMVGRCGMVAVVWSPWCSRRDVVAVPPVKASHPPPPPPPPHQKVLLLSGR